MGYHPREQRRVHKEGGWLGRRRNYTCRKCGMKFQADVRYPVPEKARFCYPCLENDLECRKAHDEAYVKLHEKERALEMAGGAAK
jgi:hypothetical protein